jgi:hypothetical protein
MNGPKPLCTLATNRTNQSNPRRLRRAAGGGMRPCASRPVRLKTTRFHQPAVAAPVCNPVRRRGAVMDWRTEAISGEMLLWKRQRLEAAGRLQHHNRLIIPVLRRCPHLIARPLQRDPFELVAIDREVQGNHPIAILRLPTPRKPPKSTTAALTRPVRSTMMSTIRPMSSSAVLRTPLPRMLCASW